MKRAAADASRVSPRELSPLLRQMLTEELTPRQRQVVTLLYEKKFTVSQCALRLGISPSTVSRTRDRALRRLRRPLEYTANFFEREG